MIRFPLPDPGLAVKSYVQVPDLGPTCTGISVLLDLLVITCTSLNRAKIIPSWPFYNLSNSLAWIRSRE